MATDTADGGTLGVEEEFHIVDSATGALAPDARRLLRADEDGAAEPELQRCMVETASAVHTDLAALRADLLARRQALGAAAAALGLSVVAAGTVPGSGMSGTSVYPDERYEWMAHEYRRLVDEQQVCACQVQVGVADRDLAVRVTRRIRAWLPVLLAMSASSPLFQESDTGYASYRTMVTSRWPTVGPPPDLDSAAAYDRTVQSLVDSGVISDSGMIYFDARPSARYPTVEVRVADACPSVDDVVALAGLTRALVQTAIAQDRAGEPLPESPQVLLRAATWRAARSGLDGHLLDPLRSRAAPARERVEALLTHVRDALTDSGDRAAVTELVTQLCRRGTSSRWQRAALRRGETPAAVVAALAATTTAG